MAVTTGFSLPYIGKYSNSAGTISYTGGMKLGRGVEASIEVKTADDNIFYADNKAAETETGQMTSATATVTIDGLENDVAQFALGLPEATQENVGDDQVDVWAYGDSMTPPELGLGVIQRRMMNGKTSYRPILFTKVKMSVPGDSMTTQEDQIDWQTQKITLTIMRDDSANRNWKKVYADQTSEAEAENILKTVLGVSAAKGA